MRPSVPTEVEAKFHVARMPELIERLSNLGAVVRRGRTLEINLRFDTPDGQLTREHRVLRLRRDATCTLTYKAPGEFKDGIRSRTELETEVADFETTRSLLESLGYVVTVTYEKYRTAFGLDALEIDLDELPFGNFIELEGPEHAIRTTAGALGLAWHKAISMSYLALFERIKAFRNLVFSDLTFDNFRGIGVEASALGIESADQ